MSLNVSARMKGDRFIALHCSSESACYGRTEQETETEACKFWCDGDWQVFYDWLNTGTIIIEELPK